MSRRPAAGPDRTEQNRAALKSLVKLEPNKSCADCKRNKHPRWASWNLGVFLCIRCSGIHRGMGTHISRVKSVDLDSWTDEQMQNMVRWGNARANKYWEHKLAEGHVPNEAKIENFIRTKYDSKRWVMEGPIPDPSTLDDGENATDDDVPLNVVREKAIERSASLKNGNAAQGPKVDTRSIDLFGDTDVAPPVRPSTTDSSARVPGPPKTAAAPPRQTKPGESLLGLDFFGTPSSGQARPSSTGPNTSGAPGRADLKSSILSLYASKPAMPPASQPQTQQAAQSNMSAFAGMQAPSSSVQPSQVTQSSFGGLNDAFSSLSFAPSQPQTQVQPSAFPNFSAPSGHVNQNTSRSALSGGSFFDTKPAPSAMPVSPPPQPSTAPRKESFGGDFGDFSSGAAPTKQSAPPNASSMGDLFDMSPPQQIPAAGVAQAPAPNQAQPVRYSPNTAFNLSQQAHQPQTSKPAAPALSNFSSLSNADAWGSNDAWAAPDPPAQSIAPSVQTTASNTFKPAPATFDSGWGDVASPTKSAGPVSVQQDEEFGGWSHASPVATHSAGAKQSSGGGFASTTDDLFGNVWE